jgi:hypothetical protein
MKQHFTSVCFHIEQFFSQILTLSLGSLTESTLFEGERDMGDQRALEDWRNKGFFRGYSDPR